MMHKPCTKCGITKPHDQFIKNAKAKDGLNWWCKACTAENTRVWGAANPDRRAVHKKTWRDANYELARTIEKASYENNRDEALAKKRLYAANNRARYTHYTQKRKAARDRATPPWADDAAIVAIYQQCAATTASTGIEHHVDHIVPLQGRLVSGLHVQNNLQILPADVNRRKYNRYDA